MLNEENQIQVLYRTVSVRTFVILLLFRIPIRNFNKFFTVLVPLRQKVTFPTVPVPQHWLAKMSTADLRTGMNWLQAMMRKKRLRKNLNWLNRTRGMKVMMLYF